MHEISRESFSQILNAFVNMENITARRAAEMIGCSEPTLKRLIAQESKPSDEMVKQAGIMISLGAKKYSKLSKAEKEKISETIGALGGGVLGFGSVTAAVSSFAVATAWGGGVITSGIESFWALLGRGYYGTYHHFSPEHAIRYVNEFASRLNNNKCDTIDILAITAKNSTGKLLPYKVLTSHES